MYLSLMSFSPVNQRPTAKCEERGATLGCWVNCDSIEEVISCYTLRICNCFAFIRNYHILDLVGCNIFKRMPRFGAVYAFQVLNNDNSADGVGMVVGNYLLNGNSDKRGYTSFPHTHCSLPD